MIRFLFLSLLLVSSLAGAQVRLARLFSDHVVLQRQQPLPVWGWAKPGETVTVRLAGQQQTAKADAAGQWRVRFNPLEAGGPHTLAVSARSGKAGAADVLIGDVWLCSGQSNMEWPVKQADHYATEKATANYPRIRHFRVDHQLALTPQTDLTAGEWVVCAPQTVGEFTAVGYYFAQAVARQVDVPIGLLHTSWGGSQAEGWISKEAMLTDPELRAYAEHLPTSWAQADSLVDQKLRRQLLGADNLTPTPADEARYRDPAYDFSGWRKADPMGQWDWKDMKGFRGQGYMARLIEIPAELVGVETTLSLAQNDSPNQIYINGRPVASGVLTGNRRLTLPPNTWQAGTNRLLIRMGNMQNPAWFGLGLMGSANDLAVDGNGQHIALGGDWFLRPAFAEPHTYTRFMNNVGVSIYNAMIAPLLPFGIRGALWYQGETNAGRAYQYRQTFPLLINDWRKRWGHTFPFYFVQLSSYGANQSSNQGSNWAELREAQTMTLQLPQTGMAVTTDVGNPADIHPTDKKTVGQRLAAVALKQTYGLAQPAGSPLYQAMRLEGSKALLTFTNTEGGLTTRGRYPYLTGFEIAGDDKVFHYAEAHIRPDNTVEVLHPAVTKPVAVRYGWADAPVDANLFNKAGFPASPFRTDTWPGVTVANKFD